jgi:hypothetical protein
MLVYLEDFEDFESPAPKYCCYTIILMPWYEVPSRNTFFIYERANLICVNSVVKYLDNWSSLNAPPLWRRYAPRCCCYTPTTSIILIPWYKADTQEGSLGLRISLLHTCKRRSEISWLLKLFESPAPMRTLRSKILQLHVYLLVRPKTGIQTRHLRGHKLENTAPVLAAQCVLTTEALWNSRPLWGRYAPKPGYKLDI